jgi:gliding motility-associated protein GldC
MTKSMPNNMQQQSEIRFTITLDENKYPKKLEWLATGSAEEQPQECRAIMVSMWDGQSSEALRIDLWTKEMQRNEMDKFFFQTLLSMADTYLRANQNEELVKEIKDFAYKFGEKTDLIKRGA